MTTTTALDITAAARVLADVVDAGVAAGLPVPYCIDAASHTHHRIGISSATCFEDVQAWADWLGVETQVCRSQQGDRAVEFCDAFAVRDGVEFSVSTNRTAEAGS